MYDQIESNQTGQQTKSGEKTGMAGKDKKTCARNTLFVTTGLQILFLGIIMFVYISTAYDERDLDQSPDEYQKKLKGHQATDCAIYLFVAILTYVGGCTGNAVLLYVVAFLTFVLLCIQVARIHLDMNAADIDPDNAFFYGVGFGCDFYIYSDEREDDGAFGLDMDEFENFASGYRASITFRFFALFTYILNFFLAIKAGVDC